MLLYPLLKDEHESNLRPRVIKWAKSESKKRAIAGKLYTSYIITISNVSPGETDIPELRALNPFETVGNGSGSLCFSDKDVSYLLL